MVPLEQVVRSQLMVGEHLLWSGRPRTGVTLRASDAFIIPFSLLWCGFAIFWEFSVVSSNAPLIMRLWGIPFVLIGLHFVFGRFIVDARQRARSFYALTNQRVIIVSGLLSQQTKSLNLRTLSDLTLAERSNGLGTIYFGTPGPWWASSGMQWPGMNTQTVPMFEQIENPRRVYDQIRSAQAAT